MTKGEIEDLVPVRLFRIGETAGRLAVATFGKNHDMRLNDFRILHILYDEAVEVAEISRRTGVDKAWIARLVKAMEQKGYVDRRPHPNDGRVVLVSITAEGRGLLDKVIPLGREQEAEVLLGLDPAAVAGMLSQIQMNLQAMIMKAECTKSQAAPGCP